MKKHNARRRKLFRTQEDLATAITARDSLAGLLRQAQARAQMFQNRAELAEAAGAGAGGEVEKNRGDQWVAQFYIRASELYRMDMDRRRLLVQAWAEKIFHELNRKMPPPGEMMLVAPGERLRPPAR
jgi:hypothetical protein